MAPCTPYSPYMMYGEYGHGACVWVRPRPSYNYCLPLLSNFPADICLWTSSCSFTAHQIYAVDEDRAAEVARLQSCNLVLIVVLDSRFFESWRVGELKQSVDIVIVKNQPFHNDL